MDRRNAFVAIGGVVLVWPLPARPQLARKVARIGIVSIGGLPPVAADNLRAFDCPVRSP